MTSVSQKCQYALRALLELCRRPGLGPNAGGADRRGARPSLSASSRSYSARLKQHGLVQWRRGVQGGYLIARDPASVTVGQVIRIVNGPLDPVGCLSSNGGNGSSPGASSSGVAHSGRCGRNCARDAVSSVYDKTTFQDLMDRDVARADRAVHHYDI